MFDGAQGRVLEEVRRLQGLVKYLHHNIVTPRFLRVEADFDELDKDQNGALEEECNFINGHKLTAWDLAIKSSSSLSMGIKTAVPTTEAPPPPGGNRGYDFETVYWRPAR